MKKLLTILLILGVFTGLQAVTKEKINQTIISVHTRVFGKNDLFKSRIDSGDSVAWNDMIQEVKRFVTQNSNNTTTLKNLNQAITFANDVLNTNKIIYSSIFYSGAPSRNTVLSAGKQLNDLQKKKAILVKVSDILKKRRFFGSKKNAVEVLTNFILVLELTTNKLIKDFNKDLARIDIE